MRVLLELPMRDFRPARLCSARLRSFLSASDAIHTFFSVPRVIPSARRRSTSTTRCNRSVAMRRSLLRASPTRRTPLPRHRRVLVYSIERNGCSRKQPLPRVPLRVTSLCPPQRRSVPSFSVRESAMRRGRRVGLGSFRVDDQPISTSKWRRCALLERIRWGWRHLQGAWKNEELCIEA